jgi:two-component system sensor kinase FixL
VLVPHQLGEALVDRTQIQQVLLNLLRNAAEALQDRADPEIVVQAGYGAGDELEIVVSDNGPGLAPEVCERLFQPFVSTKSSGMGIGLAICRTIIEGHGGRLTAESNDRGGASFRISLIASQHLGAQHA